jgi:chitin synthase
LLARQTLGATDTATSTTNAFVFDALRLAYVGIIIAQFICALGNRPQGAKIIYVGSFFVFGAIMVFMLVVTGILTVKSWPSDASSWLLNGGTSRDIVISLLSTYGMFVLASLLYGQVSHVLTCIVQYLLLLPSFINTLNIFAFCNSHDVRLRTVSIF